MYSLLVIDMVLEIIVRNSIKCKLCGDEIESTHVHDFKYCACKSVAVDGGKDYRRRLGNKDNYEETSIVEKQCRSPRKKKK
jgi:hypothetical protein